MRIKQKNAAFIPKEQYENALNKLYDKEDSLYNKSEVNQGTIDKVISSPFESAYQNRQR